MGDKFRGVDPVFRSMVQIQCLDPGCRSRAGWTMHLLKEVEASTEAPMPAALTPTDTANDFANSDFDSKLVDKAIT